MGSFFRVTQFMIEASVPIRNAKRSNGEDLQAYRHKITAKNPIPKQLKENILYCRYDSYDFNERSTRCAFRNFQNKRGTQVEIP